MHQLKTDGALLIALRKATTRDLSAQELYDQRVSFVMGSLKESSTVTRAKVEQVLAEQGGLLKE